MRFRSLPLALVGLVVAARATVPITGRSQLMLVSPQEEARLGAAPFQQLAWIVSRPQGSPTCRRRIHAGPAATS